MRRFVRIVVRLYPARWRSRYGSEFQALLDDVRPGWRDLFDVLRGALKMRITTGSLGKLAVLFGMAGLLLGAAVSFKIPDKYVSRAVMQIEMVQWSRADSARFVNGLMQQALSRRSLKGIIDKEGLYQRERARIPLENVIERMRRNIRLTLLENPKNSASFTVAFAYNDAAVAQRTNRDLLTRLMEANAAGARTAKTSLTLAVLDPASLPETPSSPSHLVVVAMGLVAGLLLGAAVAAIIRRGRPAPQS